MITFPSWQGVPRSPSPDPRRTSRSRPASTGRMSGVTTRSSPCSSTSGDRMRITARGITPPRAVRAPTCLFHRLLARSAALQRRRLTFSTCGRTCHTSTTYSCRISSARSQLAVGPSGKSTRVGTRAGPWNYFWVIYRGLKKSSPIFHPLSGYLLKKRCFSGCSISG